MKKTADKMFRHAVFVWMVLTCVYLTIDFNHAFADADGKIVVVKLPGSNQNALRRKRETESKILECAKDWYGQLKDPCSETLAKEAEQKREEKYKGQPNPQYTEDDFKQEIIHKCASDELICGADGKCECKTDGCAAKVRNLDKSCATKVSANENSAKENSAKEISAEENSAKENSAKENSAKENSAKNVNSADGEFMGTSADLSGKPTPRKAGKEPKGSNDGVAKIDMDKFKKVQEAEKKFFKCAKDWLAQTDFECGINYETDEFKPLTKDDVAIPVYTYADWKLKANYTCADPYLICSHSYKGKCICKVSGCDAPKVRNSEKSCKEEFRAYNDTLNDCYSIGSEMSGSCWALIVSVWIVGLMTMTMTTTMKIED